MPYVTQFVQIPNDEAADAWQRECEKRDIIIRGFKRIAGALKDALEEIAPDHPLILRENRIKIYDGVEVDMSYPPKQKAEVRGPSM